MPRMDGRHAALLIVGIAHVLATVALLWLLARSGPAGPGGRGWWPGGADEPSDSPIRPRGPAPLPLPDAAPVPLRLRGYGRLSDARTPPQRRPRHDPRPARAPERS
jgi:hypothetical protein